MNKIIQFLRLSRLVLLVILLLFAVIAKIARAETAYLFYNGHDGKGYASCQAACAAIDRPFHKIDENPIGNSVGSCYPTENHMQNNWGTASCTRGAKTCDAKELTHNGVSGGVPVLPEWHWMVAPPGIDAKDWFSDRFTSCENNCIVKNKREFLEPGDGVSSDLRSVTENDGTSRSMFTKRQTGEVCVVEKKKPDDPPKPPAPDNGDSTDGQSGSSPGSDSGNGAGSNGQGGEGSQGGSNGQANQGSGNSDGGGSSSGGSGSGSGGVNGSGGQTGPSGGGTSGGTDGGNESEGSEGEAGGESDGSGEESGGSGDSGGQSGGEGSGQGNVGGTEGGQSGSQNGDSGGDGDGEAGGHYFPCPSGRGSYKKGSKMTPECAGEGNGEGDGEGSIGGGSCEADTPPDCKGDPIQCYIAREQWRTACAASGKSNKIEGQGNCEQLTPPECKGDETQCYIAKQQFISACEAQAQHEARNSLKEYADGKSGIISDVESSSEDGVKQALEDNGGKIDLNNLINKSGYGWSRSCPASATIDAGVFGTFEIDNSMLCTMAQVLGKIFAALCMLFAVRYIFA